MEFETIYNGMTGREFIIAFNDNFNKIDAKVLEILGQLLYAIKSEDVKAFRVNENEQLEYTKDEENWVTISSGAWGLISGNIEDQEDLMNQLELKASAEVVSTLQTLVNTLNVNMTTAQGNITTNTENIAINTSAITNLNNTVVKSATIKAIRINNNNLQWTSDNETWHGIEVSQSVDWENIEGNLEDNTALHNALETIRLNLSNLTTSVSGLSTRTTTNENDITSLKARTTTNESNISTLNTNYSSMQTRLGSLEESAITTTVFNNHALAMNNPHNVTKSQVGLGNVDNTSDMNKPLSTQQKNYVDAQLDSLVKVVITRATEDLPENALIIQTDKIPEPEEEEGDNN